MMLPRHLVKNTSSITIQRMRLLDIADGQPHVESDMEADGKVDLRRLCSPETLQTFLNHLCIWESAWAGSDFDVLRAGPQSVVQASVAGCSVCVHDCISSCSQRNECLYDSMAP